MLPAELGPDPKAGKLSTVLASPCCPLTVLVIVTSGALPEPAADEFVVIVTAGDARLEGVPKKLIRNQKNTIHTQFPIFKLQILT